MIFFYTLGVLLCVFVANWVGRWTMRHERDAVILAEIRAAYQRSPDFTLRWLKGETDVLPSNIEAED